MFWIRLRSGIILVVLAVIFLVAGGPWLWGCLTVVSLIGLYELYRVVEIHHQPLGWMGYTAAVLYSLRLLWVAGADRVPVYFFCLFLILFLAVYVFSFPKYQTEQVIMAFFGLFYVHVMLMYVYLTRMLDGGVYLVWLIFLGSWGSDTCAYCVGMLFGKHKMAPVLSPKKSVEGAVGGAAGAMILGMIYGAVFAEQIPVEHAVFGCGIVCLVGAGISQIGDLAASAIKRNHNVKDYGKLIPGHGGILDRFDSVIFVAPAVYVTIRGVQYGEMYFPALFR